ncbi:insulinase family protein [bacterium]|nr:insulinase family protein [bacterium]
MVLLGFPGPSVHDKPDIYRMDVASFLLGIGRGSIISREVVDSEKALSAGIDFLTQRFSGMIMLYAIAPDDKIGEARQALLAAADKLKRGDISERDLQRAKSFLRGNFQISNETNAGKAESLGFYAALGEERFPADYCEQLDAVTVRDVMETANKYFTDGYYAITMCREAQPEQKRRSKLDDYDSMGRRRTAGSRWF